ncbi:MAG: GntR family transcriptional regulator [Rectinema sp.]
MLNRSGPKPLYLQLEEILRKQIREGELQYHQAIPSENELSKIYDLSRMTVRGVITRLVNEGLLYRVPGKGTFVAEPKIMTGPLSQKGIREQLEDMGYETGTTVLDMRIEKADLPVADELGLSVGAPVYKLERLRYANGEPLGLDLSYIPVSLCSDLFEKELDSEPLCDILEKNYDIVAKHGVETLESCKAAAREIKHLKIAKGAPLLLLKYTMFSQNGTPFEYSKVVFRGDRIKLKFSFSR